MLALDLDLVTPGFAVTPISITSTEPTYHTAPVTLALLSFLKLEGLNMASCFTVIVQHCSDASVSGLKCKGGLGGDHGQEGRWEAKCRYRYQMNGREKRYGGQVMAEHGTGQEGSGWGHR